MGEAEQPSAPRDNIGEEKLLQLEKASTSIRVKSRGFEAETSFNEGVHHHSESQEVILDSFKRVQRPVTVEVARVSDGRQRTRSKKTERWMNVTSSRKVPL